MNLYNIFIDFFYVIIFKNINKFIHKNECNKITIYSYRKENTHFYVEIAQTYLESFQEKNRWLLIEIESGKIFFASTRDRNPFMQLQWHNADFLENSHKEKINNLYSNKENINYLSCFYNESGKICFSSTRVINLFVKLQWHNADFLENSHKEKINNLYSNKENINYLSFFNELEKIFFASTRDKKLFVQLDNSGFLVNSHKEILKNIVHQIHTIRSREKSLNTILNTSKFIVISRLFLDIRGYLFVFLSKFYFYGVINIKELRAIVNSANQSTSEGVIYEKTRIPIRSFSNFF